MTIVEYLESRGIKNTRGFVNDLKRIKKEFQVDLDEEFCRDPEFNDLKSAIDHCQFLTMGVKANFKTCLNRFKEYKRLEMNRTDAQIESKVDGEKRIIKESSPQTAPFTEWLRELDIFGIHGPFEITEPKIYNVVRYAEEVAENEKIPWLVEYIYVVRKSILKVLRSLFPDREYPESCQIILSPKLIKKTYLSKPDKQKLLDILDKYEEVGVNAVPIIEVREAMKEERIIDIVDGQYFGHNLNCPIINIYYRVICGDDEYDYCANISRVLAHEMFHAFHHQNAGDIFISDKDVAVNVKEAEADFFSFLYCLIDGEPVFTWCAKARYLAWKRRFKTIWPYANALYFLKVNGQWFRFSEAYDDYESRRIVEKLRNVFRTGCVNMDEAYGELIESSSKGIAPFSHHNAIGGTPGSHTHVGVQQFITIKSDIADRMDEEKIKNVFSDKKIGMNSRDTLAVIDIRDVLMKNAGKLYSVTMMMEILNDYPYNYEIESKTLRRIMNTLAYHSETIWRISKGKDFFYLYSEVQPEGYVTFDDVLEDDYSDLEETDEYKKLINNIGTNSTRMR